MARVQIRAWGLLSVDGATAGSKGRTADGNDGWGVSRTELWGLGPRKSVVRAAAGLFGAQTVAYAQSAAQIVVQGNRRVEADTIRIVLSQPTDAAEHRSAGSRRYTPPICSRTSGSARRADA